MLQTITDPLNHVLRFSYYDSGRAYQQFEAGGGVRTFVYGNNGTNNYTDLTEVGQKTTPYIFNSNYRTIEWISLMGRKNTPLGMRKAQLRQEELPST